MALFKAMMTENGRVRAKTKSPYLAEALGNSHKYSYDDIVIIKGNV